MHPSRDMDDSSAESNMNCEDPAPFQKGRILVSCLKTVLAIFYQRLWQLSALVQLKGFGLMVQNRKLQNSLVLTVSLSY